MIEARSIVENTLVPHRAFEDATRRIEQCFSYSANACEPICLALVGESRTGKSRVLEECKEKHRPERDGEGLTVPILRVSTPSKPTVKSLAELMLRAMQDPLFDRGTENSKTVRLQTLMRNSGTRMVMIDEFQHFVDKGSQMVMHHVADWLKILVDDSRVSLVVAGLPTCQAVLEQNEQLAGRFLSPVFMPRFNWLRKDHREEFTAILGAFDASLRRYFDLPALNGEEMAFRCYCGSGGLMGYLSKSFRQTVWNALDDKRKSISLQDLELAHDESVWSKDGPLGVPNPFADAFSPNSLVEIVSRVIKLGVAEQPKPATRKRPPKGKKGYTVQQVLSAS
jgi:hypothetical protein